MSSSPACTGCVCPTHGPAGHSASTEEAQSRNESQLCKCDVDEPRHSRHTEMKEDRTGVDNADRKTESHQRIGYSTHVV